MCQTREENAADLAREATREPLTLTTTCIGFLLRDMLEMHVGPIDRIAELPAFSPEVADSDVEIGHLDDSDPNNLKLHLSNGQVFTIRIIAGNR